MGREIAYLQPSNLAASCPNWKRLYKNVIGTPIQQPNYEAPAVIKMSRAVELKKCWHSY